LLNRVDEIRNVNYIPNNDDILQSRRRTSDIQKLEFQAKLPVKSGQSIQQTFCMLDVGGQRGERRKWIQVFDGVSAVMFLIDSSGFDAIDEENGKNKLKETINLFYEVWTTRFLLNSNFVLLFNKQDILREKIERGIKIEDHFPEYKLYKFQPTDRHLNHNRSSDKLNLFRTSSNRSSRSSSSTRAHNSGATSLADAYGNNQTADQRKAASPSPGQQKVAQPPQQQQHDSDSTGAATTKRKSASLYLFGTSSRKDRNTKSPQPASSSAASSSINSPNTPSPHIARTMTTTNLDSMETDQSQPEQLGTSVTDKEVGRQQQQPADKDHDQETANYLAYIKARSFIRDKFIQITRQVEHPALDQRKFSSPNLPMYRTKGGTIGRGGSGSTSSRIDRPKRNVCYHYTTATDTENIRDLFENLQKMVLRSTMKDLI
jgi:hypothetical protein